MDHSVHYPMRYQKPMTINYGPSVIFPILEGSNFSFRFHRVAFVLIGNMALADFILVVVEFCIAVLGAKSEALERDSLVNVETFDETRIRALETKMDSVCR